MEKSRNDWSNTSTESESFKRHPRRDRGAFGIWRMVRVGSLVVAAVDVLTSVVLVNKRNGSERLNDIHILDTATSTWTCPHVAGVLPHPRAGMTLTALRGRLYLFGGSGTSSKCFQDLQILDRSELAWLDVTQHEPSSHAVGRHRYENFEGDGYREQRWSFGGYVSCLAF
jgi:hypothetical protein